MAIHPQLQALIDKGAQLPPWPSLGVEAVRATDLARYQLGVPRDEVASVEDRAIPGPAGEIPIRIYRPDAASDRPVVVFFHGGGFAICSIATHDDMCRRICRRARVVVVSVGYRLAPEHKFPAAPDDCFAATKWVAAQARAFGAHPARLAVAGDSAGGGLAAATALRARDEGGPAIAAQILIYPAIDHYSVQRPSWSERATGCGLTAETMRWFWDLYLAAPADGAHPWASPIRAPSLSGLSKAYIVTGEYDLLRDEGEAYAEALRAAGGAAELVRYSDMNHGFLTWVGLIDRSTEAMEELAKWIANAL
jgi:acetyl esterase